MSHLLYSIWGHPLYNGTIFPPRLELYDEAIIYKRRGLFYLNEFTLPYSHIVQVNLHKGIIFASLEIVTSGIQNLSIRYVLKGNAVKAKKLIDKKIYYALAKERTKEVHQPEGIHVYEKSLQRLNELLNQGKISKSEFEKKRKELFKKSGY